MVCSERAYMIGAGMESRLGDIPLYAFDFSHDFTLGEVHHRDLPRPTSYQQGRFVKVQPTVHLSEGLLLLHRQYRQPRAGG